MSATFTETLNILLQTGMPYEEAYRHAETITAIRQETGELSPAEMDIFLILMDNGITGKRAEDMARSINAQRVAAGTTREEEIANRPMPPERTPEPTPEPTTVTTQGPPTPAPLPPESEAPIRNELPYDLADDLPRIQDTPIVPQQPPGSSGPQGPAPTARNIDTVRSGGSIYSTLTEPGRFSRQFVVPAGEDPEEFSGLLEEITDRITSSGGHELVGEPKMLRGWATRLEDPEMRALFVPTETNRRTDATDEWNDLVDGAIDTVTARRQRVGANVFIHELVDSLPASGERFVADKRFDAGPINHAEHIYAFNELVFGEQIDMAALLRGQTIDVGHIDLTDDYVIRDVKLSSVEDYVDLQQRLYEDIGEGGFDIGGFLRGVAGVRSAIGVADGVGRLQEVFGDRFGENEARDLFEIPMDFLLLHDSQIDSSEAAREEWDVLETTLNGLGSTTGEDVGGALIRSGYEEDLGGLDPTDYRPNIDIIEGGQAQIGVIQAPGFGTTDPDDFPVFEEGGFDPQELQEIGDSFALPGPMDRQSYEELNEYLDEKYGGFAFFLDLEEEDLHIGLDKLNRPTDVDSDDAVHQVHILDYLVGNATDGSVVTTDYGIISALERTKWYQTTNTSMREWYGDYGANPLEAFQFDVSRPNQMDKVGDIYDSLVNAAQILMGPGAERTIGPNRLMMLAAEIDFLGYDTDDEKQREMLLDRVIRSEEPWQASNADFSAFRLTRDSVETTARSMYLPITEARRNEYAEKLFTGAYTIEDVAAQMRTQALARYGGSDQVRAALEAGLTMEQYFDPYIAEMEEILDRPVDLFSEFPEVIEMVPGDGPARPMSYPEFGEFIRGLPEWGQSDKGQDTARSLVNAMGALFGEVA